MKKIEGKRAVITGAASGLGRSLALELARMKCRIGVLDIDAEGARETLRMVESAGGEGETYELDVRIPEGWEAMAAHFFDTWGGVDLLVNNAGVAAVGIVGDIPLEDWEWIFSINFWGMLYGCHTFIPRMKAQGCGHIVNVASAGGLLSSSEMAPYNTTKAAVISLSETLRVETAPYNIGITVACPMFFNTNLLHTMRYTDEWSYEFGVCTFENAKMTSDEVARRIIRAVERDKLYAVPQFSGKLNWLNKRLFPGAYYELFRSLNRMGRLRPFLLRMAQKGMLQ